MRPSLPASSQQIGPRPSVSCCDLSTLFTRILRPARLATTNSPHLNVLAGLGLLIDLSRISGELWDQHQVASAQNKDGLFARGYGTPQPPARFPKRRAANGCARPPSIPQAPQPRDGGATPLATGKSRTSPSTHERRGAADRSDYRETAEFARTKIARSRRQSGNVDQQLKTALMTHRRHQQSEIATLQLDLHPISPAANS
jgi:hypothetical protein